ncbi:MAG: type I glyceraldehyde-3-phosphate dehydrogenase [Desulfobacteraceae bacterium]|nr:type I glyceraldehyde-3-phosphate dehydrogenase [Desulfobacteraceae bacterium]
MTIKIAINGFGRIGRELTRIITSRPETDIELVAVNSREDISLAAHLLRHDSNHGGFGPPVTATGDRLLIGGQQMLFLSQPDPARLPWRELGVELVIESSGQFVGRLQAGRHLEAGSRRVLITAAAPDPDVTLCLGVNQARYQPEHHRIVSASSCTTNCVAPVAKLLHDRFRLQALLVTFLHSYTSGQPLLDTGGPDLRLMRAAGLNLIPASTSAAQQVPMILPELTGRFHALSVRVPTPEAHLASLSAFISRPVEASEVLAAFREAAAGEMAGIVAVSEAPLASCDLRGASASSILDPESVKVVAAELIQLLVWHDNESSYCQRVVDLVRYMAAHS